ncbi:MAG: COX15/CtaA family protein [Gammaproteobacteria bacterium]|jgi:cytochrome c oxidase assembly protein subunit 15|nr:cytochrome B [Chromatiales bacterium]MDP6675020.1 COX15/CtaA family protein [Gammaproteobacteria bacterium]
MYNWYIRLIGLAAVLALVVVILGAWVRLTDAGLGCPDWPGCYGSLIVPNDATEVADANAAFPERPVEAEKAWHEMIHRFAATTLGLSILIAAFLAWRNRDDPDQPVKMPIALLGVVIFQGLLGMWTVTLLLKPLIVMGHLLGGLTTLGMAFWLTLEYLRRATVARIRPRQIVTPALVGLIVLVLQIALGGWTSPNYAALACPDLPTCQGSWWPEDIDFAEGFVMWRGLGVNYEFGVLEAPARVGIHYTHRLGALVAFLLLGFLSLSAIRNSASTAIVRSGHFVIVALITQLLLGISVVWFGLPLFLAAAHNGIAALLLLAMINLNHAAATYARS